MKKPVFISFTTLLIVVFISVMASSADVRFSDNSDGTITDVTSNTMWLKDAHIRWPALTWEEAREFCKNLEFNGHKDWRLPTTEEWKALIDQNRKNPSLPASHPFQEVITTFEYWTEDQHPLGPGYVWQVSLWYGNLTHKNKTKRALVWPVRSIKAVNR